MENNQILKAAREIGGLIQQDDRFARVRLAEQAADADQDLQELIGEFNLKRIALNNESTNDDKDEAKLHKIDEELREVYARLMANDHMQAYQSAKADLDNLVHQIITIVNLSAQGENPETVETEHSCGGHCATCGGCH